MKIKVCGAIGDTLDYLVSICEKETWPKVWIMVQGGGWEELYTPSTDWAQGGPIIERKGIRLDQDFRTKVWLAIAATPKARWIPASTPLIAAMRCYVASKLGDEVDIPEELCCKTC